MRYTQYRSFGNLDAGQKIVHAANFQAKQRFVLREMLLSEAVKVGILLKQPLTFTFRLMQTAAAAHSIDNVEISMRLLRFFLYFF